MSLRSMSRDHDTRAIEDPIARDVLAALDREGPRVAAVPSRLVEVPPGRTGNPGP